MALSPDRMAGLGVSMLEIWQALQGTDAAVTAGHFDRTNRSFSVTSDSFVGSGREVAELVVSMHQGRPVYLRDIAQVTDGPEEPSVYTRFGFSNATAQSDGGKGKTHNLSAVTLALAKKRGTNAVQVANEILEAVDKLKKSVIPDGVEVAITRNYGQTAQNKVNDLLSLWQLRQDGSSRPWWWHWPCPSVFPWLSL